MSSNTYRAAIELAARYTRFVKQRWIDLLAAVSVLVCTALIGVAGASFFQAATITPYNHQRYLSLTIGHGNLCISAGGSHHDAVDTWTDSIFELETVTDFQQWQNDSRRNAIDGQCVGFEWVDFDALSVDPTAGMGFEYWRIGTVPFWFLIGVSLIETRWILKYRKRHQAFTRGCCAHCGYGAVS